MQHGSDRCRFDRWRGSCRIAILCAIGVTEGFAQPCGGYLLRVDPGGAAPFHTRALDFVGDLDCDGRADLVLGDEFGTNQFFQEVGVARAFSSALGRELFESRGTTDSGYGASVHAFGDVDRDGVDDYALSSRTGNTIDVRSGVDGRRIYAVSDPTLFGPTALSIGDLDGDMSPEWVIGSPGPWPQALTKPLSLRSGRDGSVLGEYGDPAANSMFGVAIASLGDVDHDAHNDFVVLASNEKLPLAIHVGTLTAISSHGGGVLWKVGADALGGSLFDGLQSVGDLDSDGTSEFAVTLPAIDLAGTGLGLDRVAFVSGANGTVIVTLSDPQLHEVVGTDIAASGDFDLDGDLDVAISAQPSAPFQSAFAGRVRVVDGTSGTILLDLSPPSASAQFGSQVAGGVDVDLDGYTDLAVASADQSKHCEIFRGPFGIPLYAFHDSSAATPYSSLSVGDAGDLDQDGVEDYRIGPWIKSGTTGEQLLDLQQGAAASFARVGDLNSDGIEDYLAGTVTVGQGSPTPGFARAVSGASGTILKSWVGTQSGSNFGYSVAAAGDIDLDGIPDVVIGAPKSAPKGVVHLFSGATGGSLTVWSGGSEAKSFGTAVTGLGDIDHDGRPDVAVTNPNGAPVAEVRSSKTGLTLYALTNPATVGLGGNIAAVGDLDGDGSTEFAAGVVSFFCPVGQVEVHSPALGKRLFLWSGFGASDNFGHAVASARDVDGDGVSDVVVGSTEVACSPSSALPQNGRVEVFSGKTGAMIFRHRGAGGGFGSSVAGIGDQNGDSLGDLLVGAVSAGATGEARIYATRALPIGSVVFANGCAGSLTVKPRIACAGGEPSVSGGNPGFAMVASDVPVGAFGVLIGGATALDPPVDLTSVGNPGCQFAVERSIHFVGVASGLGIVRVPIAVPNLPELSGLHFQFQWAVAGQSPVGLTAGFSDRLDLELR